jgi:dienelactone hydrolase
MPSRRSCWFLAGTTVASLVAGAPLAGAAGPEHATRHAVSRSAVSASSAFSASGQQSTFRSVVKAIEAVPYTTAYAPTGDDRAFAPATVPNDAPAEDYTSGSIPGDPDAPAWPTDFTAVTLHSTNGATLTGELALHPGHHPAVLVVHGFNTHGDLSVIRWAAMLAYDGYDVLAADQRDFSAEYAAGYGYPKQRQTFGWKEAQDVLAAGRYLRAAAGVRRVGVVGFSEGAQNTVLAMARDAGRDRHPVFAAGLTFSGPADQNSQIDSTAEPPGCTTDCTYPATDALVSLVVPPYTYTDPCSVLADAATRYHTSRYGILAGEDAYTAQRRIHVPLLNFYAADDPLVSPDNAVMMAGEERGRPLERTVEISHGQHAYYDDRWWQQKAILTYFGRLLPHRAGAVSRSATVDRTTGGTPIGGQLVGLGHPGPATSAALRGPFACDRTRMGP